MMNSFVELQIQVGRLSVLTVIVIVHILPKQCTQGSQHRVDEREKVKYLRHKMLNRARPDWFSDMLDCLSKLSRLTRYIFYLTRKDPPYKILTFSRENVGGFGRSPVR